MGKNGERQTKSGSDRHPSSEQPTAFPLNAIDMLTTWLLTFLTVYAKAAVPWVVVKPRCFR